jgi:hypothetical protein
MKSETLNLTKDAWTELLSDGGSVLFQDSGAPILVSFSETGQPALDAAAFFLEPHQTANVLGFNNVPVGTSVWVRAQSDPTSFRVAK